MKTTKRKINLITFTNISDEFISFVKENIKKIF